MSVSLYRKYRPQNFASVVGQKPAVSVITNAISKGRIGHAYLFSGSRGCGKTSIARIFAKALNCLNPDGVEPCGKCSNCLAITAGESLDVIEIDGASNNSVDNIRELRENVTLAPFSSKYKIYIIDEVHMLSQGAFNALLKTLEEPPEYVVFILATTEPHKVPVTIRSRCQHIPFHSISTEDINARLKYVCSSEGVAAESEALYELARQADGALRDALSLLEQVTASGDVTLAGVEALLGAGSRPAFERWLKTLRTDTGQAYADLKAIFDAGASNVRVFEELFSLVRNLWLVSKWKGIIDALGLSGSEKRFLLDEVNSWKPDRLHSLLNNILRALSQARQGMRPDILLGMFMLSLEAPPVQSVDMFSSPAQGEAGRGRYISATSPISPPYSGGDLQDTSAPSAQENKTVNYDTALKEEMLKAAHEKDFLLFCSLFDVMPYLDSGKLVLDVQHSYSFDRLCVDTTKSALAEMFASYGQVCLQYNGEIITCKTIEQKLSGKTKPEPPSSQENASAETLSAPSAETLPAETFTDTQTEEQASQPENTLRRETSPFEKYRQALTQLDAQPEILFIKHLESDTQDDTPSQEGENDNDDD